MKGTMLKCRFSLVLVAFSWLYFGLEVSARSLRLGQLPSDAVFLSEQAICKDVLAKDQSFWGEMANGTEWELHQFSKFMIGKGQTLDSGSGLRLISIKTMASPAPAELEPMAAMLDGLYEDSKKRIVQLNQHEAQSKTRYSERQEADRSRMTEVEAEFNHQGHHMSAALQANDTALKNHLEDEEQFFMKYWTRVRERNHKQYHTCLKIQHNLMDRLKSMRAAYQQAASQSATSQPDVAASSLIQHQSFVQEALEDVARQRAELSSWD